MLSKLISIALTAGFILLVVLTARKTLGKLRLHLARKAEAEGRFSEAYQHYCALIFAAGRSFALPQPDKFESENDIKGWISKCASAYTNYVVERPSNADLRDSSAKLENLGSHLTYVENKVEFKSSTELSLDDYVEALKFAQFPDQREVPETVRKHARKLYDKHISIIWIEGDGSCYVEGCFYNVEQNLSAKYTINYDPGAGAGAFLAPGDWVAVSRIVPESSNPQDKVWREARDLRGRYAATFLTVPKTSHVIRLRFVPHLG